MAEPKRLKLEETPETATVGMDIISNLPDSLLCHILSFLPTTTAVDTTLLSRRWRDLWKDLQAFDFSDNPFLYGQDREHQSFVVFVNEALAHRRVHHIQKFRLSCWISDKHVLAEWIRAAIGSRLQELHLSLHGEFYGKGYFSLPHAVLTCTSLVSLTLRGPIYLDDGISSVHLPSLKNLELNVATVSSVKKLLCGCPALKALELMFDVLKMHIARKSAVIEDLEIDMPSLEYLDIDVTTWSLPWWYLRLFVSDFPNMVEAHLSIELEDVHVGWVPELLRALGITKSLVLDVSTIMCLYSAPAVHIPDFCHLLRLQVDFPCFDSTFLVGLLRNCHVLQVLEIHNWKGRCFGRRWALQSTKPGGWTQPANVPNCVKSHLNILEFGGYEHSAEEHEFAAYILQRGLVLKTMTIHTKIGSDQKKKYHILKELSVVLRGSSICRLKLD